MRPALPLPATRSREPCCAPGGMRTSTVSGCRKRPSPWQVGQTLRSRPVPSQRGQVRLNFIAPAIWVTLPRAVAFRANRGGAADARRCRRRSRTFPGARYSDAPACRGSPARNRCSSRIRGRSPSRGHWPACAPAAAAEELAENVAEASPRAAAWLPRARRPLIHVIRKNRSRRNPCPGSSGARSWPTARPPGGMFSE